MTAIVLGVALDRLMDQVQQAIVDARNAGLNLEVEAGREVSLAIQNAKNAYSESMNVTLDKIDKTSHSILDQLSSMVADVQNRNEVALRTIASRVQQLVNTLPFAHLQPQITDVTPRYIVPSTRNYNVTLQFVGNFLFAAQDRFKPEFSINGQRFAPVRNTSQELSFSVPSTVLFPLNTLDRSRVTLAIGDLSLPWEKSIWLGMRHERETDHYKVLVGALPSTPGQISIQYNTSRVVTERQRFVQGGFHLASTREAGNNDQKDVPFTITPHNGWHVVRGTSKIEAFTGQGDYTYPYFVSDDADRVTYRATTIHHGIGSSGSMDFSIGFDEVREVTVQDTHMENIDLKWGDSVVLPPNVIKVIFDAFDGSHAEFGGADLSNRYLKVRNEGGNLIISTADPSTLSVPSNSAAARERLARL